MLLARLVRHDDPGGRCAMGRDRCSEYADVFRPCAAEHDDLPFFTLPSLDELRRHLECASAHLPCKHLIVSRVSCALHPRCIDAVSHERLLVALANNEYLRKLRIDAHVEVANDRKEASAIFADR